MLWACSDTADVYVFASQLTDDSSPAEAKFAALIENPENLVKLDQKHLLAVLHGYDHETQQREDRGMAETRSNADRRTLKPLKVTSI